MSSNKTTHSTSYSIRFNVASMRDSSDEDDDDKDDKEEESFIDPLLAVKSEKFGSSSGQFLKKVRKKKLDVVKLESNPGERFSAECETKADVLSTSALDSKITETSKAKTSKARTSLIRPISALRKKHSPSMMSHPQSAPSSELSSPTTFSKRSHISQLAVAETPSATAAAKDNGIVVKETEKESKSVISSASDVALNSNANNCNNKEDVFSIFSGLKDKLARVSAESREILDRKVFKTSSVDVPKISSMLAGSPVEGEFLAEEAKEETLNEAYLHSKVSEDKTSSSVVRQPSSDSIIGIELLETEMVEFSPRNGSEAEIHPDGFDISRLMRVVQGDSSKKLVSRHSVDDEMKSTPEEAFTRTDDSTSSLDVVMTPSDILSHEVAVDAFRCSASNILDQGTKRLPEGVPPKTVKKSSTSTSPVQKSSNPFLGEKKEGLTKSSSISMTLSSLLSRQKSSSKLPTSSASEVIVMTTKIAEAKEKAADKVTAASDRLDSETASTQSDDANQNQSAAVEFSEKLSEEFIVENSEGFLGRRFRIFRKKFFSKFFLVFILLLAWLFVPLPPYMAGMTAGILWTLVIAQAVQFFNRFFPTSSTEESGRSLFHDKSGLEEVAFFSCDVDEALDIRESKNSDGSFKGWLNELGTGSTNSKKPLYDPNDYHINSTHSVYATLEGTNLRLQTPRLSMPKRALWSDDSPTSVTFVRQRHYDLLGSKVSLLPVNLVPKRLWSKKYPIYIEITKISSSAPASSLRSRASVLKKQLQTSNAEINEADDTTSAQQLLPSTSSTSSVQNQSVVVIKKVLYLFTRTSREKEEWFRRLRASSLGQPWPTRFSDIVQNLSAEANSKKKTHKRAASQPSKKSIVENEECIDVAPSTATTNVTVTSSDQTSSATTDYSTLSPEQNLLYYAQYMSRVIGHRGTKTTPRDPPASARSARKSSPSIERNAPSNVKRNSLGVEVEAAQLADSKSAGQKNKDGGGKAEKRDENDAVGKMADDLVLEEGCYPQLLWLNTLISRCFMDFLRERFWVEKMREKIQKKLSKIHIPFIMDQLSVTGIDLGSNVPFICKASKPYLDDRGFWVDLGVSYSGGFCITMETKCNLMKLKHSTTAKNSDNQGVAGGVENSNGAGQSAAHLEEKRIAALCSDEEDSAESSTDEESKLLEEGDLEDGEDKKSAQPIGKRLLRLVDKISQSRYFQQATDYKYIRRAIEEVSNTRLELNVEVKSLVGTLAINVPPPPTDRLWYGFRGNPQFELVARPRVGIREVSLSPVTEWIEKKLAIEFQRVFVMPNMDDVVIPLMLDHLKIW